MSSSNITKSIREQIVNITIDIDDKIKIIHLLEKKIKYERDQLSNIDEIVSKEYEDILNNEIELYKNNISNITESTQVLLTNKTELINKCNELISSIKEQEQKVASDIRNIYHNTDKEIENERRQFRKEYDERLQKFLASKAVEYKESTAKALNPEIARLQMEHEKEYHDTERFFSMKERDLEETQNNKLVELLKEERSLAKEELVRASKNIEDKLSLEYEYKKNDIMRRKASLQEDYENDLSKLKEQYKIKTNTYRQQLHNEIKQLQSDINNRINDYKKAHQLQLDTITIEHEKEINKLTEQLIKINNNNNNNNNEMYNDSDDEYSQNKYNKSPNKKYSQALDNDLYNDVEFELELSNARKEAEKERDTLLQAEIRKLETETLRLERQWKKQSEIEMKQVMKHNMTNQRIEEEAELIVKKEMLSKQIVDNQTLLDKALLEETTKRNEIQVYRDGINAHKGRIADKEEQLRIQLRELQLSYGPLIRDLKETCLNKEMEIQVSTETFKKECQSIDMEHTKELNKLDLEVKSEVKRRDSDLQVLQTSIDDEKAKIIRLEKLIKQYNNKNSSTNNINNNNNNNNNDNEERYKQSTFNTNTTSKKNYNNIDNHENITTTRNISNNNSSSSSSKNTIHSKTSSNNFNQVRVAAANYLYSNKNPSEKLNQTTSSSKIKDNIKSTNKNTDYKSIKSLNNKANNNNDNKAYTTSIVLETKRKHSKDDDIINDIDNDNLNYSIDNSDNEELLPAPPLNIKQQIKPSKY